MRKITLTITSILMVASLFGQSVKKKTKIVSEDGKLPNLELNRDLLINHKKTVQTNANAKGFNLQESLNFQSLKETNFIIEKRGINHHVSWLKGFVDQSKSATWSSKANGWVDAAAPTLGIDKDNTTFEIVKEWTDDINQTHIKMNQVHKGVKVYAGEIILHGKKNQIFSQNGFYVPSELINENRANIISETEAIDEVSSKLNNLKEDWKVMNGINLEVDLEQWESELVYYKNSDGRYDLMFHIKVYPNLAEHYEYFVDGQSGKVVDYFSTICNFHHSVKSEGHENCNHNHSDESIKEESSLNVMPPNGPTSTNARDLLGNNRAINTYSFDNSFLLIDASRSMFNSSQSSIPDDPAGAIWTIDLNNTSPANSNAQYSHVVSNNNSFSQSNEGVSAHYNAGIAYEYYENTFNRESISQSFEGDGQTIISFVNVADEFGNSMGNAFWNGAGIFYGNGDSQFNSLGRALDVAGHEMSHGVIQNTANLEYRNESGALNESLADIFGAMMDRDDWKMGEDVVKTSAFPSGALRDLSDPHNGASTGDFARGWQPKHFDERFTGPQDNGGVHLNSGIPNHAYYLFATNNNVGKEMAEKVYYRALTTYLTKSSGFAEMRSAVVRSAQDLGGSTVVSAARSAFSQVGIMGESDEDFQDDFDLNPGEDYLLEIDQNYSNIYIKSIATQNLVFDPISSTDVASKPSISDDGSVIVFVGEDGHIHFIQIDWTANPPIAQEGLLSAEPEWDNVAISKDGRFLAAIDKLLVPRIFVFDLFDPNSDSRIFTLYNPTTSNDGAQTSEVQYADVIEFDPTGNTIMYDAVNLISSNNSTNIEYYDIGFLNFRDSGTDSWTEGKIDKLFGSLPSGTEVANPSYSKNSPFIIAFDVVEGVEYSIYGVNLETKKLNQVFMNTWYGFPNYSKSDQVLIYDFELLGYTDIGGLQLQDDKISAITNTDGIVSQGRRWGTWFSTGDRLLSDVEEVLSPDEALIIYPNPAKDVLTVELTVENISGQAQLEVSDISGKKVIQISRNISDLNSYNLDISNLEMGSYILSIRTEDKIVTRKFIKS